MAGELIVLLNARKIGRVEMNRRGRLFFTYDENWSGRRDAVPLSVSMPLAVTEH
jgi:serine/threonine-protein kinase HipA